MTFESLVQAGHLRRSDRTRFARALGAMRWYPRALGYLQRLLTLRSGAVLVSESYSGGTRLRVLTGRSSAH